MKCFVGMLMMLLAAVAVNGAAVDDNVDVIVKHMKQVIDNVPSIPKDRADKYKTGIESARPCIADLAKEASAERINSYVEKLLPISVECGKDLTDVTDVEQRKTQFEECVNLKVKDQTVGLDDLQRQNLKKVMHCVKEAVKQQ